MNKKRLTLSAALNKKHYADFMRKREKSVMFSERYGYTNKWKKLKETLNKL